MIIIPEVHQNTIWQNEYMVKYISIMHEEKKPCITRHSSQIHSLPLKAALAHCAAV